MTRQALYLLAADAILIAHMLFVAFVVFGLLAIYIGHWRGWQWVRNRLFRLAHLAAIGIVVLQSWAGIICPLTTWEMRLRELGGDATYAGSFIQHWLHTLLYFEAPDWVFVLCYTAFGGLVLASWTLVPPRNSSRGSSISEPPD